MLLFWIWTSLSLALANEITPPAPPTVPQEKNLEQICLDEMKVVGKTDPSPEMKSACAKVQKLEGCDSVKGAPIFHYDKLGTSKRPQRIFAKALIHGDEVLSGMVAKLWMERLEKIEPRNTWRVIPIANPDGWKARTRMNANGVDLNRNFPTENWEEDALKYWKVRMKSDPRRNPGPSSASEVETQCLLKHLDEFKPDMLISVHTPLGVLDLDGPKMRNPPSFRPLPWTSLGTFPGSLGRYMWVDRKIPVLTIELKGNEDIKKLEAFDRLQDISGTIAIQADQLRKKTDKK